MKLFFKVFSSKCDQIHSFLRIWLDLLKKSLMENFIFCAVEVGSRSVNLCYFYVYISFEQYANS